MFENAQEPIGIRSEKMNADEIVSELRESCTGNEFAPPMVTNRELTEAADLIESLQAQLEKAEKGRLEGVELYNKYIVLCHEKSKRLHELETQLDEYDKEAKRQTNTIAEQHVLILELTGRD